MLLYILVNTQNVKQKSVKCDITHFATKNVYILASNWMQRFQFGCNPDLMDLTFLLPLWLILTHVTSPGGECWLTSLDGSCPQHVGQTSLYSPWPIWDISYSKLSLRWLYFMSNSFSMSTSYIRHKDFHPPSPFVTLMLPPPLDSEMGWTGELW